MQKLYDNVKKKVENNTVYKKDLIQFKPLSLYKELK